MTTYQYTTRQSEHVTFFDPIGATPSIAVWWDADAEQWGISINTEELDAFNGTTISGEPFVAVYLNDATLYDQSPDNALVNTEE